MLYSEDELKRWWQGLGKVGQRIIFEQIQARASSAGFKSFASHVKTIWARGDQLTEPQLQKLREWGQK